MLLSNLQPVLSKIQYVIDAVYIFCVHRYMLGRRPIFLLVHIDQMPTFPECFCVSSKEKIPVLYSLEEVVIVLRFCFHQSIPTEKVRLYIIKSQ